VRTYTCLLLRPVCSIPESQRPPRKAVSERAGHVPGDWSRWGPRDVTAVTGNVTVVNSTSSWAVYLGPDPVPSPLSSNVNFSAGQIRCNGLSVALSAAGTLSATYMSITGNTTDLVFDVTGFFIYENA